MTTAVRATTAFVRPHARDSRAGQRALRPRLRSRRGGDSHPSCRRRSRGCASGASRSRLHRGRPARAALGRCGARGDKRTDGRAELGPRATRRRDGDPSACSSAMRTFRPLSPTPSAHQPRLVRSPDARWRPQGPLDRYRTTNTSHGAWRTTFSAVEPSSASRHVAGAGVAHDDQLRTLISGHLNEGLGGVRVRRDERQLRTGRSTSHVQVAGGSLAGNDHSLISSTVGRVDVGSSSLTSIACAGDSGSGARRSDMLSSLTSPCGPRNGVAVPRISVSTGCVHPM